MKDASLSAWLRLTLIPGIGGETQRKLLTAFGLPEHIFAANHRELVQVIGDKKAQQLSSIDNKAAIEQALQWAEIQNHHIVTLADASYPASLLEIADPPSLLYARGNLDLLKTSALAVVGTRNPTPQGLNNAEQFSATIAGQGWSIISGLALGIDAAAHQGALRAKGATIAVIGTGIDRIYPARNKDLALTIADKGIVISEFALGTPATAFNFPKRNRIISGLAKGVLVVEAAIESGSLITARLAVEQGREVFAIPGSIHSPQTKGCHRLIKDGAKLVETAQDILDELPPLKKEAGAFCNTAPTPAIAAQTLVNIAPPITDKPASLKPDAIQNEAIVTPQQTILKTMGYDPSTLDELVQYSGLSANEIVVYLLELELNGNIASLPGGRYQRIVKNN